MTSKNHCESSDQLEGESPPPRSRDPPPEEYICSEDEDSTVDFSDTDESSGSDSEPQCGASWPRKAKKQVCMYYNQGHCKYGRRCRDLHVCKYFMQGECHYGQACRLRHIGSYESESSSDESEGAGRRRSRSRDREARDNRPYTWQLDSGNGWKDIAKDHIIEAQYSRPSARGINLYNTPFGVLSIDFNRMKVRKKTSLRIRRLSSKQAGLETEWIWYYRGNHSWVPYGQKNSRGNGALVTTSQIEREFQSRRKGTLRFTVDMTDYEINFREMHQKNLSSGTKRKVARRPRYRDPKDDGRRNSSSSRGGVTWQFKGDNGSWHNFKPRSKSAISSADIEVQFQRNPHGSMSFTLGTQHYVLDFKAMTQMNRATNRIRAIRRVSQ